MVNFKLTASLFIVVGLANCAYADYQFKSDDPTCQLWAYKNQKWVSVPASQLPDDAKFKTLLSPKNSTSFKQGTYQGVWYSSKNACFVASNSDDQADQSDQDAPEDEPKKKHHASHTSEDAFFAEALGQYVGYLGSNSPSSGVTTSTTSGVTTTTSPYSSNISWGLGVGWLFSDNQALALDFEHMSGSLNATVAGNGITVSLPFTDTDNRISANYLYYFLQGTFRPFVDVGLGYSFGAYACTISGFPASASTDNGTLQGSGSGPLFNLKVALDVRFGSFSAIPFAAFEWEKYSNVTVTSSSSSLFTSGQSFGSATTESVNLGVAVRYWF